MADARPLRLLGVFAHPDDEVFCAGGTLAKYVAGGAEAMVVSMTRGQFGQIRDAYAATRQTLGSVREAELRQACAHLGVQHNACLDYVDGTLSTIDSEQLIADVVRLIRSFRPDIVITFDRKGGSGHPDHIAISTATTSAFMLAGKEDSFPEQRRAGLDPYQPRALYHSLFVQRDMLLLDELALWLTTAGPRFRASDEFVQAMSFFASESTTLQYVSDDVQVSWYAPGLYIVEQGEIGDSLYLILSGQVDVVQTLPDGTQQHLARKQPGEFFGEMALTSGERRMASIIAVDSVTCLVLSRNQSVVFAGRGEGATLMGEHVSHNGDHPAGYGASTCIDVGPYLSQKVAAIAAHRTQYPIKTDMFPESMLHRMMGREYFARVFPSPQLEDELVV